jgi:acetoin utilization deacetylase AcuC-like enzyme
VVEITGLAPGDPVVKAIIGTFKAVKGFVTSGFEKDDLGTAASFEEPYNSTIYPLPPTDTTGDIRLAYNINIVLPETSDLKILNAIFRSIRENLMR